MFTYEGENVVSLRQVQSNKPKDFEKLPVPRVKGNRVKADQERFLARITWLLTELSLYHLNTTLDLHEISLYRMFGLDLKNKSFT